MIPESAERPATEVVVVNFNAGEALLRCVRSVLAQDEELSLTVIDNASTDDSVAQLEGACGEHERLQIVRGGGNPGFAAAVNRAVDGAPRDYLLILNPDCELRPGALSALRQALESDSSAALAGPLVTDESGRPQRATLRRFPDPWRSFLTFSGLWRLGRRLPAMRGVEPAGSLPADTTRADAVSGACMLVKKELFLAVGGMDEAYGLHCEDLDLMYRLRQAGHHCLFVPRALAVHQQGVSSRSRPFWAHRQKHLGMQRFFLKFQAGCHARPVRWLVLTGIWLRYALTLPLQFFRS